MVATDSGSPHQIANANLNIAVFPQMSISTINLSPGNRQFFFFWNIAVQNGTPNFTYTLTGNLPDGVTFNAPNGYISGTPTQAGSFPLTVKVVDSGTPQQTATADITLVIQSLLRINTTPSTTGIRGRSYTGAFGSVNGVAPLHWTAQNLIPGLNIDPASGVVSGIPSLANAGAAQVTVTDSSVPQQSDTVFWVPSIIDNLQIISTDLGKAIINQGGSVPISFSGGLFPISMQLVSGTPPAGFQITQTFITVTPTQLGHYSFVLKLSDSASPPQTAQATFTMDVVPIPPRINPITAPRGIVGKPYELALSAQDGTPPYTWSENGAIPDGLVFDSQGSLHGTPTKAGFFGFGVFLTDSGTPPQTAAGSVTINVLEHALGRNDSIATATPISGNGAISASISPYSDPSSSGPDSDYYKVTANPGATVFVSVIAQRLAPSSTLDSVIEIVDASGTRFNTCNDPVEPFLRAPAVLDPNPNDFNNSCINDDDPTTNSTDSSLQFKVPGTSGPSVTFYIHVLDYRGDARPDMVYQLGVSGANP